MYFSVSCCCWKAMHLFVNFVKKSGHSSLCVSAQNEQLLLLHHKCTCYNIFNLPVVESSPMQTCYASSRPDILKYGMEVGLLQASHASWTPYEEHGLFPIMPKETDPPWAGTESMDSASGVLITSVFWWNSPWCKQLIDDWTGIGACSTEPSSTLPPALHCQPALPWPQAGTSTSPELLVLIAAIWVETTASVGVNCQDLGNAKQNQLKK